MDSGAFRCEGWESGPVLVACTFLDRWRGLKASSAGLGMLIRGGSVHSLGIREPLLAIGLDDLARVVGFRILLPRRAVWIRSATHILELPIDQGPPPLGAVLTWLGGGSPDSLRNSHRQPE